MRKLLLIAGTALALSACGVDSVASAGSVAAPLSGTTTDEQSLLFAVESFDSLLTVVDTLVAVGVLEKNSPRALKVQMLLRTARTGLNAAVAAQKAGNEANVLVALSDARLALAEVQTILKPKEQ